MEFDEPTPMAEPETLADAVARYASDERIATLLFSEIVSRGRGLAERASADAAQSFEREARSIMRLGGDDPSPAEREITTLSQNLRAIFEKNYLTRFLSAISDKLVGDAAIEIDP